MKTVRKSDCPPPLADYVAEHPDSTWEQLSNNQRTLKDIIATRLRDDQGGICCYCEIDLKIPPDGVGLNDFRVEHFHPKSDRQEGSPNWAVEWSNLFGCCHGGSARDVVDARERFAKKRIKEDATCDVPKGEKNWDHLLVNPLQIPPNALLVEAHRTTGELSVNHAGCHVAGLTPEKVEQTLRLLNLNSQRLTPFRQRVTHELNRLLLQKTQAGLDLPTATRQLAEIFLRRDEHQNWPAFFSTIRSYLGPGAEQHLKEADYQG